LVMIYLVKAVKMMSSKVCTPQLMIVFLDYVFVAPLNNEIMDHMFYPIQYSIQTCLVTKLQPYHIIKSVNTP